MPDYFTETELRALPDMSSGYSTERIESAAAHVVGIIEREVGTSFVARTVTDERHDGGRESIVLNKAYVLSATSATEDGVAVTDTLRVSSGVLRRFASATDFTPISWATGIGNVTVTYQAGYSSTPPADLKEAALQATRWHLIEHNSNNSVSPRQTSLTNEMGGTVNFAVAGKDRPTGYPDIDAVIVGWRNQLNVFGFA